MHTTLTRHKRHWSISTFQLATLSVREERKTVPTVYCMQLGFFFRTRCNWEIGYRPPTKFHHFVPVLLHETHPYYNRPPAEHLTTAVSQQASPARSGASRPLCLPVLGNVEALNLARDVIYRNLHLPVCICRLLLFAASWAQLPDSDGAIFRPWHIRFANWGESDAVDWAMVPLVTCCFQRNTTMSLMGIVTQ